VVASLYYANVVGGNLFIPFLASWA